MSRLTGKDLKTLLAWIVIGIVGAVVAVRYFHAAFPEAALNLKVSKVEALETARNFLAENGMTVDGYESSIVFHVDENAKTYLEREVGLEQANKLMAGPVVVWAWNVRFFRPQQQEEFSVSVSPAGRVVGFSHTIEEARAGAKLERDRALAIAEKFAGAQYAEFASYDFLPAEANSDDRPNRRDWSFTWERHGFKAPPREDGAPYRLRVGVQGDKPGASSEFLKVPEAWQRSYQKLRSSNTFYGTIAVIPYLFLNGAMLWVLFGLGRRGIVRWSGALKLGFVLAILFFAMTANNWPMTRAGYDTNSSYPSFVVQHLALAIVGSLALGLMVALTVAAGEPLYRWSQPEQLRLNVAWTLPGIRTKEFFRSCVVGLGMAAGHIGFVVLFYFLGSKVGVWAPQDIPYTDVLSTKFPWLFPLTIGAYAATSEEFLFRLFAIPFLMRVTNSRVLAVVLPAFFWGFLHSTYPQQPGYIRGIEVGLIGIVAGVVMLRYGILATLVWHYTVDAALISLFLLRSGNLYFRASGALVAAGALIPLLISGGFYLARRRFEPDEALLNRAEVLTEKPVPEAMPVERETAPVEALSAWNIKFVVSCGVLGLLLVSMIKPQQIGDFLRFQIDAQQAAERADSVLRARGVKPERYHRVTTLANRSDAYVNEFLRRKIGIAGANRVFQDKVPLALWRVRYFRDGETEEYAVVLRPDGALHSVHHTIEEKTPGAKLAREEAQVKAETYLRDEKQLDLQQWRLVDSSAEARPARTDHHFVWEEKRAATGSGTDAAHVRAELNVLGDEVSGYRVFVKIPEQWERDQQKRTLPRVLRTVWTVVLFAGLGVAALVLFFKNLRQQAVPWKRIAKWALVALAGSAITTFNNLPSVMSNYPTAVPLGTFRAIMSVSLFIAVLFGFVAAAYLLGLAWFYLARAFGEQKLPGWSGQPASYYRDALIVGVSGTAALAGLGRLSYLASQAVPTMMRSLEAAVPSGLDAYLPGAEAIGHALSTGIMATALVGLAAGFIACYLPQRWMQWALLFGAALALAGDWGSAADFAKHLVIRLVALVAIWVVVRRIVRFNAMAYFLIGGLLGLVSAAAVLLKQPNAFLRMNGWVAVGAAVVLVAWPLVAWRAASQTGAVKTTGAVGS
ncbi:MAG: CPBP family intramembrane metalloprotease [Acidobacteriia bacterium]|nr:CPBP family intramembrane metalloprotease [Terriglobia bacterium]